MAGATLRILHLIKIHVDKKNPKKQTKPTTTTTTKNTSGREQLLSNIPMGV